MPRLFSYNDFAGGSEIVRSYADKHSPVVICDGQANYNQPFTVKVRIGKTVKHPNSQEHHFRYIQLWNLETLVGEVKLKREDYGDDPVHIEVPFSITPKVSLRLTALAYCNKHGLWKSEEIFVKVLGIEVD
ncbi:MAG: desulfoferrodoxin family protein [Bacteroidales bacterium]|jgi:superoxide reductase|nr:desulfoferrodoxin family protein [Bacteroidales bacterium]MDD3300248.1 desulfoferrodoxin family protein [Bacteroidales bacterium]MDD3843752.1 desulfoferrodoxin family protein [Bacteroidales bacterium]MDD4618400.1 desulfoferrodoxin family protein [Bacteroidales bacterium]